MNPRLDFKQLTAMAMREQGHSHMPGIIKGTAFQKELSRFIPQNVIDRTLAKPEFLDYLTTETVGLLERVARGLHGEDTGSSLFEL